MNAPKTSRTRWEQTTTRRLLLWFFRWQILRRVLLAIAVLVTLPTLFYAVENWRGKQAWERHRHDLEAKGEKVDMVALAPAPVPDSQNLALAPMLKPIFDFSPSPTGPLEWHDTNGLNRLERISAGMRSAKNETEPKPGNLEAGTFADLEVCRDFYLGNTNYPQPIAGSSPAQVTQVALGKFDADFQELKAAAAARPASRFPINYDAAMPFAILLPHLARLKSLSSVLELRATANLELRQNQPALSDWDLGFRLGDSIREEPVLIDHLVRIVMLTKSLQVVREGLVRHVWTEDQLATIQQRLATVDLLAEYRQAMRGERACIVGALDWARRQGWKFDPAILFDLKAEESPDRVHLLRLMPGGWYYRNMVTVSRLHQEYTLAAVNVQTRRVNPPTSQAAQKALEALPTGPYTVLAKELFPAVAKATVKSVRTQTYVDAARVACALERHRLANGQLPESLNALAPRFLDRIPADPIDGQPLRYHRQPDSGYLLYSVGWNQTDDGGRITWTTAKKSSVDAQQGDWVWSLPR